MFSPLLLAVQLRSVDGGDETRLSIVEMKENYMGLVLLIVLIILLAGGLPTWPHSKNWGYGPSGVLGVVLIVVVIMLVLGYIPRGF